MSANNQILIFRTKDRKWAIKHIDMDCGEMRDKFPKFDDLEDAVKGANKFMACGNEVEYGIKFIMD